MSEYRSIVENMLKSAKQLQRAMAGRNHYDCCVMTTDEFHKLKDHFQNPVTQNPATSLSESNLLGMPIYHRPNHTEVRILAIQLRMDGKRVMYTKAPERTEE